jgi:tetrahydromethanopterin S-methyltransferase subunit B
MMRSNLRSDLAALIHQADHVCRRLRALDATVAAQEAQLQPEPTTLETDPATDLLLAGFGEQIMYGRRAA